MEANILLRPFFVNIINYGEIECDENDTIFALKQKIDQKFLIHTDYQRLVFAGRPLADARYLSCYNIRKGSLIHLGIHNYYGDTIFDNKMQLNVESQC